MTPEILNGVFAISGALIGAVVAGFFAWIIKAKYRSIKKLKVFISKPKALVDVHDSLKGIISIHINEELVDTVANVDYHVVNTGNEVLKDVEVDFNFSENVRILGGNTPSASFNSKSVEDLALFLDEKSECTIKVGFLNPREEIKGHLLLNKVPDKVEVNFRQPNVVFEVNKNYDPERTSMLIDALYEAARQNYLLHLYLKLTFPAYGKGKNGT